MINPDTELKIWAAGVFEGEGSALINRVCPDRSGLQIVVGISNMDERITDPIKAVWGGHYPGNQNWFIESGRSSKRNHSILFSRDEAKKFLVDIFPYLRAKQDRVLIIIRALYSIPGEAELSKMGRRKAPKGVSLLLEPYYQELRRMSFEQRLHRKISIE